MTNPKTKAWLGFFASIAVMGSAIFLAAGTIHYWQAWLCLLTVSLPSIALTHYTTSDPVLLEGRNKRGPAAEQRPIQKIIVLCAGAMAVAIFIVAALDHRFGWSRVPLWLTLAGDVLIAVAMAMVYRVFRENSFGAATVQIAKDQTVISTGPYAIVRNPMYACATLYFVALSLALGSYWGLIPAILATLCLIWRLFDEENFLAQNLPGYRDYCAKVRWHLIPHLF